MNEIHKDLFYLFDFLIRDFIGIKELSNIKVFLNTNNYTPNILN
jgi:hypothetical protein